MNNILFNIDNILASINCKFEIIGDTSNKHFSKIGSLEQSSSETLVFINSDKINHYLIKSLASQIIILKDKSAINNELIKTKCFIIVDDPKLAFIRVANKFFKRKIQYLIHPTAVIHPKATLHDEVFIGPFTYIGECEIGKGSIIYGNSYIYDGTIIGESVIIHAGCMIGVDGLGHIRNEKNEFESFPQNGNVIIKNSVEIGANCTIDRGTLNDTIIDEGSKISNQVYIAHNSRIGKHTMIIAFSIICGSCIIGDFTYIGPSVTIRDSIEVGNNVFIGMGSVVTKDVPEGETWVGSPATKIEEFKKTLGKNKL